MTVLLLENSLQSSASDQEIGYRAGRALDELRGARLFTGSIDPRSIGKEGDDETAVGAEYGQRRIGVRGDVIRRIHFGVWATAGGARIGKPLDNQRGDLRGLPPVFGPV